MRAYRRAQAAGKSDLERTDLAKDKSGMFTGAHALNPINGARVPIWVADYVLMGYGTGAIMAVPAHDERDFEFATRFALPIVPVIAPAGADPAAALPFTGDGLLVQSGPYTGLAVPEAKQRMTAELAARRRRSRDRPLQAARLAFLAPALLGRALPDRLGERGRLPPGPRPTGARISRRSR